MSNVFRPTEAESVRHIPRTKEDRTRDFKNFKDRKSNEAKIKDERFAAIQGRRNKKKNPGGRGGGTLK